MGEPKLVVFFFAGLLAAAPTTACSSSMPAPALSPVAAPVVPATPGAHAWRADPTKSKLAIDVYGSGILAAHDHHFVAGAWAATMSFDPEHPEAASVDLRVAPASLHDEQDSLSESARREVDDDMRGPDVLDTARYPTVTFAGHGLTELVVGGARDPDTLQAVLLGSLGLHGRSGPARAAIGLRWGAGWLHAHGKSVFKQTDFGVAPVSKFFGALAVEDTVAVDFDLVAVPEVAPGP